MTQTQSTAVANRRAGVDAITTKITDASDRIMKVAFKGFSTERMVGGFLQAVEENPKLAECTPISVANSLVKAARWGLDIGDGVHLVPFNKKVTRNGQDTWISVCEPVADYRGLKALLIRQRIVKLMTEGVVYEGDTFEYELGLNPRLRHVPAQAAKRGRLIGAYTIITDTRHEKTGHYMPIEDIEAIRAKSKSWGPDKMKDCPPWYAMKTVVRNWASKQPRSGGSPLEEALQADDTEIPDGDFETIDPDTGEVLQTAGAGA